MRLVLLSDTHGRHKKLSVPDGDVLVHCGDFSHRGSLTETHAFGRWFAAQPHLFKLLVPGNHDAATENPVARNLLRSLGIEVLIDQAATIGDTDFLNVANLSSDYTRLHDPVVYDIAA